MSPTPITSQEYATIPRLIGEYSVTMHQGKPLMSLIERNLTERRVSSQEMSDILKTLVREKAATLSDEACYFIHFQELLVAYYEARATGTLLALQGAAIQQQLRPA